jgi:hypothetical protein
MKVKVWFEHRDGPYSTIEDFASVAEAEESYQDDPFFICATDDLDYQPPVYLEFAEQEGWEDGVDGIIRENPHPSNTEAHRYYARGRREGEAHYRRIE